MQSRKFHRRTGLARIVCASLVALISAVSMQAAQHTVFVIPFDKAQRLREALDGKPESRRTRRDYDHVLDAYRAIYHGNPAASKADASISAVGELLAEEGRLFDDEKALHDAIGQFEFLRREYPTSRLRQSALFTEGEIERRDLGDRAAARKSFEQFLKLYPQHSLAEQARAELKAIQKEELAEKRKGKKPPVNSKAQTAKPEPSATVAKLSPNPAPSSDKPQPSNKLTEKDLLPPASETIGSTAPVITPAPAYLSAQPTSSVPAPEPARNPDRSMVGSTQSEPSLDATPPVHKGRMPLVTGIRHWSTPTYTRIAIDLEAEVHYEAARVLNPDRIYFDLLGTRLAPELIGKSFDVTDEGYLRRIRIAQFQGDRTRVVLDVSDVSDYSAFLLPNPWRLIIDIHGGRPAQPVTHAAAPGAAIPTVGATLTPAAPRLQPEPIQAQPQTAASSAREVASISHQPSRVSATASPTTAPIAATVVTPEPVKQTDAVAGKPTKKNRKASKNQPVPDAVQAAAPTADGQRSLVRALGLKISRIVIDAGHGGHDSGTLGPDGIQEKDVVLDVALRLGKLLHQRLGAEIIYTRDDDTFIPLETRTAIANKAQADLFLSIHANSSSDSSARGVEVYYLNFTSSPDALEVAARENAVGNQSIHQLSDLVKKITLKDKIDESREFATDVDQSLYAGLQQGNRGLKDRGVKKAPFVVLIGANMPSILAEISFLTNPDDARKLQTGEYRQRIAESIARGVEQYYRSLASVHSAVGKGD